MSEDEPGERPTPDASGAADVDDEAAESGGEAAESDRRRLIVIGAIGLIAGLSGGFAVTFLEPGNLALALSLIVLVGAIVTYGLARFVLQ